MKNPKFTKLLRDAGLIIDSRHKSSIKPLISDRYDPNDTRRTMAVGIKLNDIDPLFFKLANYNNANIEAQEKSLVDKKKKGMIVGMYYRKELGNYEDFYSKRNIINSGAKIDFSTFVNSIEVLAALIFPNENSTDAIDKVVGNILSLSNVHENKNNLELQIEYLKLKDERSDLVKFKFN